MSETEKRVKDIWSEVFHTSDIALTDNFFEIGGDSIKGMQIITKLNQQLSFIEVTDFFEYQTIADIGDQNAYKTDNRIEQLYSQNQFIITLLQTGYIESPHPQEGKRVFHYHGTTENAQEPADDNRHNGKQRIPPGMGINNHFFLQPLGTSSSYVIHA